MAPNRGRKVSCHTAHPESFEGQAILLPQLVLLRSRAQIRPVEQMAKSSSTPKESSEPSQASSGRTSGPVDKFRKQHGTTGFHRRKPRELATVSDGRSPHPALIALRCIVCTETLFLPFTQDSCDRVPRNARCRSYTLASFWPPTA